MVGERRAPREVALGDLLAAYRPDGEVEAADVRRLIDRLAHDDVWSRSAPLHVTASALIVHPPSRTVLLRWHPGMEAWLQVGGHFDPGEADPWVVAAREATEETGLTDLRERADPGRRPVQIVVVPVPARGDEPAHEHADVRYLMITDRPDEIVAESSAARLRWLSIDDAVRETTEANLRVFLERVAAIV